MAVEDRLLKLKEVNRRGNLGGGEIRIRRQHNEGKLLARERIEILLDPGRFVELDRLRTHECNDFDMQDQKIPGDAVVTGSGVAEGGQSSWTKAGARNRITFHECSDCSFVALPFEHTLSFRCETPQV